MFMDGSFLFLCLFRRVMVPSLHVLLLLWGLQGLLAQDYEDNYEEEEVVPNRKKSKIYSPNSLNQNGKCKWCHLCSLILLRNEVRA